MKDMMLLVEPLIPALRRYARALLRDRSAADDLVQDCLEHAISRWHQRRPDGNARSWVFAILHNLASNQLRQIRDAINSAADNDDLVTATIVNASDGAHLVLSSVSSGASHAIQVSQSGGDGGLARLEYNPDLTTNFRELREAADSRAYIAGELHTSATNVVEDAIDGVTITLIKADPGEVKTVSIANDSNATASRVKSFVEGSTLRPTLANRSVTTPSIGAGTLVVALSWDVDGALPSTSAPNSWSRARALSTSAS